MQHGQVDLIATIGASIERPLLTLACPGPRSYGDHYRSPSSRLSPAIN
jgi:hypothetical protein